VNVALDVSRLLEGASRGRLWGLTGAPRLSVALARLVDLKAVLLAETRARGPDGSRMRSPQLARCSRDQLRRRMGQHGRSWRSVRSHVVEAAGVRSSERRRAWADSSKRASVPDAEPPPRARSTHYSPRAPVSLTRRLRRAVAVRPEEPGLTPGAPTLLRRRHRLLHGHRAASPGAASLGAATRGAAMPMRGAACA
jgi:hypothetical protein